MRVATGFDFKTEVVGRRLGDVPDLTADPAYAEKELGFRAPQDLVTMCRDLWNWQSRNPEGYEGPSVEPKKVNGVHAAVNGHKVNGAGKPAVVEDVVGPAATLKGAELRTTSIVSEAK
ncbi:UDP-glucose-4-epimerase [Ceratobasidium sp. 428]|nr:UDP-glucose-4-epimerase [Ceratobasidium sp. 428]